MKIEFSGQIFKKYIQNKISCKSVQWEPSCSIRKDGRTHNMTNLIVAVRNFGKRAIKADHVPCEVQKRRK